MPTRTEAKLLVERDAELEHLRDRLARAREAQGSVLLFEGGAGIGKTELVQAAVQEARGEGIRSLIARGSELERGLPFGIVRQLLDPVLVSASSATQKRLFGGGASRALQVFEPTEESPGPLGDSGLPLLHGLYWLVANLTQRDPLLLAVDDMHWADAASLRFISFLQRRIDELPVFLLLAARTAEPDTRTPSLSQLFAETQQQRRELRPLSEEGVARLLSQRLERSPDAAFVRACHDATRGSPLYISELVRTILDLGLEPTESNANAVVDLGPETVANAVRARISESPGAIELARAAAILGDGADARLVAELAGVTKADATRVIDALIEKSILEPGPEVSFVHPVVRAAVYTDIAPHARGQGHLHAARLLESEGARLGEIASHLQASEPADQPDVARILERAADHALQSGAADAAADYLRRALREPPSRKDRPRMLRMLGLAEVRTGDPTGIEHLRDALDGASDPRARAECARDLALGFVLTGQVPKALDVLAHAISGVEHNDPELAMELEAQLAAAGTLDIATVNIVKERLDRYGDRRAARTPGERVVLANVAYRKALANEAAAVVVDLATRALAGDLLLLEQGPESPALAYAVMILLAADEVDAADAVLLDAVEEARRRGSVIGFALMTSLRSNVEWRKGAISAADAEAHTAGDVARLHGFELGLPMALAFELDAKIERGEFAEADAELERSGFSEQIEANPHLTVSRLLLSRGKLRLARGQTEPALSDLLLCGKRCKEWGAVNPAVFAWRSHAGLAHYQLGHPDEARRLCAEEARLARTFGAPRALGIALRAHALVVDNDRVGGLKKALAVLGPSSANLEHARTLVDLGAAMRRENQRSEARTLLNQGLAKAQSCGATALADRAAAELAAAGARPRKPLRTGLAALTPSELRISRLATDGLSNREIAQSLFVTIKTVEMHLGNAYKKLGIHSRRELAGALKGD